MLLPTLSLFLLSVSCDKLSKAENEHRLQHCGKRITDKILNARYNIESPWTVGLVVLGEKSSSDCTGTVISTRHVLTATHCVAQIDGAQRFLKVELSGRDLEKDCPIDSDISEDIPNRIAIFSGSYIPKNISPIAVAKKMWLLDPCGDPIAKGRFTDLTLIELDRELQFNSTLNMACVSNSIEDTALGAQLDFYGYGDNKNMNRTWMKSKVDRYLGHEQVVVLDEEPVVHLDYPKTIFLARPTHHRVLCQGDSGGGAMRDVDGRVTVVGVASHSTCDSVKSTTEEYEVYSRVSTSSNRICEYAGICTPVKMMNSKFTSSEMLSMLQFVAKKSKETVRPLKMLELWTEYKQVVKTERSVASLRIFYDNKMRPNLHKDERFDTNTLIRMAFATGAPIGRKILEEMKETADIVDVNYKCIILRYKKGNLELSSKGRRYRSMRKCNFLSKSRKPKASKKPVDLKSMLKPFRDIIMEMDARQLTSILRKIDVELRREVDAELISWEPIRLSVALIFSACEPPPGGEYPMMLRYFLNHFSSMVIDFDCDGLFDIQDQIKMLVNDGIQGQISMDEIRMALENAFVLVHQAAF